MDATVISIPKEDENSSDKQKNDILCFLLASVNGMPNKRNVIHSIKVGIALVLVSLLYVSDPLFEQVGENAMWAIMTVVVVFEFSAGATLSKGINRAIGTILGGGLGCLAALVGDKFGRAGNAIVVATSVFVIGAAATYLRSIPNIRKRYDYGAMIFILTFNLVAVSGLRADTVIKLARVRLSTIGMGFVVCISISLLIFPMWASDEVHRSTATNFNKLASCIQVCVVEYFRMPHEEKSHTSCAVVNDCKMVLHSKSQNESLVNFAKWEPWHGKFGLSYPWEMYHKMGETLREIAAIVLSLELCRQSPRQPGSTARALIKEETESTSLALASVLRELGESISAMKLCRAKPLLASKLPTMEQRMSLLKDCTSITSNNTSEPDEIIASTSFIYLLMEMVEKVEALAEQVESCGKLAGFHMKKPDVVHDLAASDS